MTEVTPPGTAGTALTLRTAAGFTLAGVTILLVSALGLDGGDAWHFPFMFGARAGGGHRSYVAAPSTPGGEQGAGGHR